MSVHADTLPGAAPPDTAARSGLARPRRGAWLRAAASAVGHDPGLWPLGALGFSVRGGLLALTLPILVIPSPVFLSIIFKGDISTSGVTSAAGDQLTVAAVAAGVLLVVAMVLAAFADLASFERTARLPATAALRSGRLPRELASRQRLGLLAWLIGVQALGLVPVAIALASVGQRIVSVTVSELQFPSELEDPLIVRILNQTRREFLILIAVIVVMDAVTTVISRAILVERYGLGARSDDRRLATLRAAAGGLVHALLHPVQTLVTDALAWLATMVVLGPVIAVTMLAWDALRSVLLDQSGGGTDAAAQFAGLGLGVLALAGFGAIWVLGITLVGIASSLRQALWTAHGLA